MDITHGRSLAIARRANGRPTKVVDGVTARRQAIDEQTGLTAVIHDPDGRDERTGVLLWLFGGGLVSGNAAHVSDVASDFATQLGALVVAPDYRIAPEYPYPAALEDVFATLRWIIDNAGTLRIDPDRIVIGGESAGGGLAAALAQKAHDQGIELRLQVLIAPMLDDRTVQRAESEGIRTVLWTINSNRFAWTSYLGHSLQDEENRPYAVPARRADLHGLAPAWISVGSVDLFHDEDADYSARLRAAGVQVSFSVIPGAHHGVELLSTKHPQVKKTQSARLHAMRDALADRST